ncbi:hypothetical protein OG897_14670 [Streptomyces sp. NBC_00237]|nr:hypothetical protein [Streptomyces sp. NBC_00237]MCX5202687.1 hypothetical protein [Streptomyces sp. NBC_00237]
MDDIDALAAHYGVHPLALLDGPTKAREALSVDGGVRPGAREKKGVVR